MNFELPHIPARDKVPRENGLTMMMDKGLSWREAENFIDSSAHLTDLVKFGFGTSYVTKDLQKKLDLYKASRQIKIAQSDSETNNSAIFS